LRCPGGKFAPKICGRHVAQNTKNTILTDFGCYSANNISYKKPVVMLYG
jgi:hypothetical protein